MKKNHCVTIYLGKEVLMKRLLDLTVLILFTYPVWVVIGTTLELLEFVGIAEVVGRKNFPKQKGRIVLVSNHPSLVEPIILAGLFFRRFSLRPRYGPWTLIDKWWYNILVFCLVHPRLIPVMGNAESLVTAKKVLSSGGNLIIFSEGSRTWNGVGHVYSKRGKRLLPLKKGIAVLATLPETVTVPVWVEFCGRIRVRITIGEPMHFQGMTKSEVIKKTTQALLQLADQTG